MGSWAGTWEKRVKDDLELYLRLGYENPHLATFVEELKIELDVNEKNF